MKEHVSLISMAVVKILNQKIAFLKKKTNIFSWQKNTTVKSLLMDNKFLRLDDKTLHPDSHINTELDNLIHQKYCKRMLHSRNIFFRSCYLPLISSLSNSLIIFSKLKPNNNFSMCNILSLYAKLSSVHSHI